MRISNLTLIGAAALVLGGCASRPISEAPEASLPAPLFTTLSASPITTPPVDLLLLPPLLASASAPFPAAAAAELEALPAPAEDLWNRIRGRFALADLDNAEVAKWEQWYGSRPDYVTRMIDRGRRYMYYVVVEVEQRGMPAEIALLPMVESAFNPNALSTSRASGIWQFMPSTGTHYGLKQNFWFDSRRDVVAATESALTYLDKLHVQFDDWQLALAAYNWGEGNVARAVEKNRRLGRPTDYASLGMPDETRNYLPKLQALKNIVSNPEKYGLQLGDVPDAPYFAVVRTSKEIDIKRAAELAEMPVEEFRYLNPHHNRPVIAGADQYTLLLPIDKAELFAAKLDLVDQPLVSWQAYRMRPGDTLQQVATRYGMTLEALRAVNGIGAGYTVPPGHALLVPAQHDSRASAASFSEAVFTTVPQGRTFYYRVTRGDTVAIIASRYEVTADDLRRWNRLHGEVKPGQKLRITSSKAPLATTARGSSGKATGKARHKASPASARPAVSRAVEPASKARNAKATTVAPARAGGGPKVRNAAGPAVTPAKRPRKHGGAAKQ
ncbi:MAG: transglycosylase SLT domain-containing protein [Casimicrobiaceae bacterium]